MNGCDIKGVLAEDMNICILLYTEDATLNPNDCKKNIS